MHYEQFIFWINLFILFTAYIFMQKKPQKFKIIFMTTTYAYILAAFFPYLLLRISLKEVILLYAVAIIAGSFIIDKIISGKKDLIPAAAEQETQIELIDHNELAVGLLDGDMPECLEDTQSLAMNTTEEQDEDIIEAEETTEEAPEETPEEAIGEAQSEETPEEAIEEMEDKIMENALIETVDYQDAEQNETNLTENNAEQIDIEQLINEGFKEKFSGDYVKAIQIFEQILSLSPPEDLANMVSQDIDVMRKKLI